MHTQLPWANCRLQLASDEDKDSDLPLGIVGRLYHTPASHPAVRQTLRTLVPRKVSLPALAVQHVVNRRGPDALIGAIPGETTHAARLLELCTSLYESGEALVTELPMADVVLVPRVPATAQRDGLFFVVYATNLRAVELCEALRREGKAAVVLDVDQTLIDATSVTLSERDWALVDWVPCRVATESGAALAAQWALLENHDDPLAEAVYLMHWRIHGCDCTFHVRVRKGWAILRAFLVRNADRFTTFICSKGKREYLELLWSFLDPEGVLMPRSRFLTHMTSTFPDSLREAAPKSALVAMGCGSPLQPHVATQLAAPVIALDDSRSAYFEDYEASVLYVEEYQPSETQTADCGSVLWQATRCLDAFWQATCTEDGAFAWQAAQSFASALLGTVRRTPMESPDAVTYLQLRCRKQGEVLWHQFTAGAVFGGQNLITDDPELLAEALQRAQREHDAELDRARAAELADEEEEAMEAMERSLSAHLPSINLPQYALAAEVTPPEPGSVERVLRRVSLSAGGATAPGLPVGASPVPSAGGSAQCLYASDDADDDASPMAIGSAQDSPGLAAEADEGAAVDNRTTPFGRPPVSAA